MFEVTCNSLCKWSFALSYSALYVGPVYSYQLDYYSAKAELCYRYCLSVCLSLCLSVSHSVSRITHERDNGCHSFIHSFIHNNL